MGGGVCGAAAVGVGGGYSRNPVIIDGRRSDETDDEGWMIDSWKL